MPKYTIVMTADHTGTARRIELDAATPWLALEKTQARFGWLSAEVLDGARTLARVELLPLRKSGVWQISPPHTTAA